MFRRATSNPFPPGHAAIPSKDNDIGVESDDRCQIPIGEVDESDVSDDERGVCNPEQSQGATGKRKRREPVWMKDYVKS